MAQWQATPPVPVVAERDAAALRRLRLAKGMALAALVVAGLAYGVTFTFAGGAHGGWGYLRAAGEAGLVGGAADWFAVTALFRRPLGLPIPHTALIPARKDALGRSMQEFVGENFLAEAVVRERLAAAQVPARVGRWLEVPANARQVADRVADLAETVVRRVDPTTVGELADVVSLAVEARLPLQDVSPFLGRLLGAVVDSGGHRLPVSRLLESVADWLDRPDAVKGLLLRVGLSHDTFIGNRVVNLVERVARERVRDLAASSQSRAWHGADALLMRLATALREDPATRTAVADLLASALRAPELRTAVRGSTEFLRQTLADLLADHDGELRDQLAAAAEALGHRLGSDPELAADLEQRLATVVGGAVVAHRDELTTVIGATVARWDGEQTARRIELLAGRDLQFIRLNGTGVGALVGIVLHALSGL